MDKDIVGGESSVVENPGNVKISVIDSEQTLYKVAKAGSIGLIPTKGSQNTFGAVTQELNKETGVDVSDEKMRIEDKEVEIGDMKEQQSTEERTSSKPKMIINCLK